MNLLLQLRFKTKRDIQVELNNRTIKTVSVDRYQQSSSSHYRLRSPNCCTSVCTDSHKGATLQRLCDKEDVSLFSGDSSENSRNVEKKRNTEETRKKRKKKKPTKSHDYGKFSGPFVASLNCAFHVDVFMAEGRQLPGGQSSTAKSQMSWQQYAGCSFMVSLSLATAGVLGRV